MKLLKNMNFKLKRYSEELPCKKMTYCNALILRNKDLFVCMRKHSEKNS